MSWPFGFFANLCDRLSIAPKAIHVQILQDTLFHQRLWTLTLVVHSFFWWAFHRSGSWTSFLVFGFVWLVQAISVINGPYADTLVQTRGNFMHPKNTYQENQNGMRWLPAFLGFPMCMLLSLSDSSLCNQNLQATHFMRYFITDSEGTNSLVKAQGKSIGLFHHRNGSSFDILRMFRHISGEQGQFRIVMDYPEKSWSAWFLLPFARWLFGGTALPRERQLSRNSQNAEDHFKTLQALQKMISLDENVPQFIFPDRNGSVTTGDRTFFYRAGAITTAAALDLTMQDQMDGLPTDAGPPCGITRTQVVVYRPQELEAVSFVPALGPSATFDDFCSWLITQRYNISQRIMYLENQQRTFLDQDDLLCGQCRTDVDDSQWTCRNLFSEDIRARNQPKCSF